MLLLPPTYLLCVCVCFSNRSSQCATPFFLLSQKPLPSFQNLGLIFFEYSQSPIYVTYCIFKIHALPFSGTPAQRATDIKMDKGG